MMKVIRYISLSFFAVLFFYILRAQNNHKVDAVNQLRVHGKIYVVVLVLVTVMMGVLYYISMLDKRQKNLENEFKNHK